MSDPVYDNEEQVTVLSGIGFDDATFARLVELSESTKVPMQLLVAAIVRDVLEDDAIAHGDDEDAIYRPDANRDLH